MLLLFIAALLGPAAKAHAVNRIIGGEECDSHSQPWQVALYYFDVFICGGVLIHESWVLTAAHCYMSNIQVRLGAHNLKMVEDFEQLTYAEKQFCHSDFNTVTYDSDIMLLKLASPATLNQNIQTIPLPWQVAEEGTNCLTSGWGTTTSPDERYPDVLQCVNITVVSMSVCQERYPNDVITDNMLCAGVVEGGKDSCQGDSGGPLVYDSVLQGITSWGERPCGEPNKPGIYTKVFNYINWISDIMERETPSQCQNMTSNKTHMVSKHHKSLKLVQDERLEQLNLHQPHVFGLDSMNTSIRKAGLGDAERFPARFISKMYVLVIAALLGPVVRSQVLNRIIGGTECAPNSQPWQSALYYFDEHVCGGVLIDENWVLTAAHCNLPSIQVRLGDHNLLVYEGKEQFNYAEKICPHKEFNPYTYTNDIMLLKLASPVSLNAYVQTIPLGCPEVAEGASCLVSGWGTLTSPTATFPDALHCVNVNTFSTSVCQQAYPSDEINDNMLCAGVMEGGKDSCQGDSGGPLVCDGKLHGITSWGNVPCGEANKPGIYTKVCKYLNWIQDTMASGDCI
ncbi:transmembrane protease serine 9-like [Spea bombifrons]|uniref:transmembrane protease serine 9-like n=1 Tax=Spea bombifrons TaxID=233779 RepID=UPI002349FF0D|nr:transmembrane protease serine 9-like [Spea bombifrons]